MKDPNLVWFLAMIFLFWIMWFQTGGPQREASLSGPFIRPPAPISTGAVYGTLNLPDFLESR